MTDTAVREAADQYAMGMSLAQVAQAHTVSAMTIRKELVGIGCKIRPAPGKS